MCAFIFYDLLYHHIVEFSVVELSSDGLEGLE